MKVLNLPAAVLLVGFSLVALADSLSMADRYVSSPLPADYRIEQDGSVTMRVCFNWSCARSRQIRLSSADIKRVKRHMQRCPGESLHSRLQRLRIGIWGMEVLTMRHIPVLANDLAVNDQDAEVQGRTDCVDNTTNTTTFLLILQEFDTIPEWRVVQPKVRDRLSKDVHWTATVIDRTSGQRWAVDSWFRRFGHLPFVSPIADWSAGRRPWEPPNDRYNPYSPILERLCP